MNHHFSRRSFISRAAMVGDGVMLSVGGPTNGKRLGAIFSEPFY